MKSILDTFPFPFNRPEAQELLLLLAQLNPTQRAALNALQNAGLNTFDVNAEQPPMDLWRAILELSAKHTRTRTLVQGVYDKLLPTSQGRDFLGALLTEQPAPFTSEPRSQDGTPHFIVNSDEVIEQETLLYYDDLMIQIGLVPKLIQTLQRLIELAPAVCRLVIDVHGTNQYGTGFRIGRDWLLTNWHVVHSRSALPATRITAEFGYDDDGAGGPLIPVQVACATQLVASSQVDDWAIIQTTEPMPPATPIIPLTDGVVPEQGQAAFVIQHPNSDRKRLAYVRNQVSFVDDRVVQYLADTQAGSSGSPVFNAEGKLIGLHHAGGRPQEVLGKAPLRKNEGIRISRILKGLTDAGIELL